MRQLLKTIFKKISLNEINPFLPLEVVGTETVDLL